jgi:hypothetical protein
MARVDSAVVVRLHAVVITRDDATLVRAGQACIEADVAQTSDCPQL